MSFHDQKALVQPQVTVCTVAHKGSSWFSSELKPWRKKKQSSSVRGKRHTTRVLWCTIKFRHRLHDDEKVPYAHVTDLYWGCGPCAWQVAKYYERYFVHWFNDMVSWIFTPWKNSQLKQAKKAHYVSKPFDLLEITITIMLQLRKFW